MAFGAIEKLRREYTDKFVQVDGRLPELRRFDGLTGKVKTVNMSGRALVEFGGHNNLGWHDLAVEFLRIVDAPPPAPPPGAAREKKAAPTVVAKSAAKKPAAAAKASVAEILAAARAGKGSGAAPASKLTGEARPARETGQPTGKATAKNAKKMSTAEILAAARKADRGRETS